MNLRQPLWALAIGVLTVRCTATADSLGPPAPTAVVAPSNAGPAGPTPPVAPQPVAPTGSRWANTRPRVDRAIDAEEAVALAWQHSPVLAAMQQDVEMARQMLAMARARTAPMLGFNAWGTYGDAAMILGGGPGVEPAVARLVSSGASLDANFMAMVPLFTGGRLGAQVSAERQRLHATGQDLQTMRLDMALQVRTMVRQAAAMQAMIEVAAEAAQTSDERLRLDRAAHAAGRLPLANVLRDEAELANSRQQCANRERDYRVMLADLKAMLGVHPLSALAIAKPAETLPPPAPELAADLDTAARQRPELAGARARVIAAGHDVIAADAAFLPQLSLFGMSDLFASRMNAMGRWEEYTVGLGVSLPLFDDGMRTAQARRARAERARLTAQEQDLALRVARDVVQAHERLQAARTNIATARAVLTSAREDYRLMQLRYQAGLAVNAEVLDALRMRTMAQVNELTAVLELAIAEDQRRRATGEMGVGRNSSR